MTSVLMVCLGNICRSPLAEGILKSKVDTTTIQVDSAGTESYHVGELPDKRSIATAKEHGIDITDQRARKFTVSDFKNFDHIFVMDKSNYSDVLALASDESESKKVSLILNESNLDKNREVPDPYYGGDKGFENVFKLLDSACDKIAAKIN